MHGKAKAAEKQDWVRVENTHEAIISQELWDTVQAVICKNARDIDFSHVGLFAGFLRCGDCGRAMVSMGRSRQLFLRLLPPLRVYRLYKALHFSECFGRDHSQ